jgi:cell division protein FtsN
MTPHSEERELVLGNRQLLSFFFVVVALCGVFFAIGYIIGRNTSRAAVVPEASAAAPAASEGQPSPLPSPAAQARDQDTTPPLPSPEPSVQTKPAQEPLPIAPALERKPPEQTISANSRLVPVSVAEKGASYLQVTAVPRSDAEAVVRTLKEQSFPAIMTESSREGFYRVLVGPYREAAQLSTARDSLRALGFANTIIHKE